MSNEETDELAEAPLMRRKVEIGIAIRKAVFKFFYQ